MFSIPTPPSIEPTDDMRKTVVRLFPSQSIASHLIPFFSLALTFRHRTGKELGISSWQHGCIETLGERYSELLIAHTFLDDNPDCSANAMHDATRKKGALLLEAEKELQLVQIAILPADLAASRPNPSERTIRICHSRLIGALALTMQYRELKEFFKRYYSRHRPAATAGLSFKTVLQEFTQAKGRGLPAYGVLNESGPDHAKTFDVQLKVGTFQTVVASGKSKKHAEEAAAEKWLRANAHTYLHAKALENVHSRKPQPPRDSRNLPTEPDWAEQRELRFFGISDKNSFWLQRALTHPSVRATKRLPDHSDNRTAALFGSILFTVGFAHCIAARYFSVQDFRLQEASLSLMASNAVSADAVGPIAERLGIMRHARVGSPMLLETLSLNQRASFLEAVTAVRFLDQAPNFDLCLALDQEVLAHFEKVASIAKSVQDLKGPLTRLLELAGCQQIRAKIEESIITGPNHQPEIAAQIRFASERPQHALVIRGGKGGSGKAAKQSLAAALLPVFKFIHCDLSAARRQSSNDLVDKLAPLLLPTAFAVAPQTTQEAKKWRSFGLLGSGLLSEGDFANFSIWADEATKYLDKSGVPLQSLEKRAIGFYRLIGSRRVWDVRSTAECIITALKEFASSGDALTRIRGLRQKSFFVKMQQLLRVLSLAAKADDKRTTLREAFDGLGLLRRRDNPTPWIFDGPELIIHEREGATIELCSEILDALSSPIAPAPVLISIRTAIQDQATTVVFRRTTEVTGSCQLDKRLDSSLLINFLVAEGFVEAVHSERDQVTCLFPPNRANTFVRRARIAAESPFAALEETTRSALSKLLHDLKNHLIGAEVAVAGANLSRTMVLRAQAEASEHLDAACRLADQFATLAGVLGQPEIAEISVPNFFKKLCARLFTTLPQTISLGVPGASKDVSIWTSEQFIESILDNLFRNSVEAMEGHGRLELAWESEGDIGDLLIKVRDTGPGISPELLQRLIAGESVSSSKAGGSGVGMLTVVSMLRRLGGRIAGSSSPTGGTEWILGIPSLAPTKSDDEPVPTEPINLSTE